MVGQSNRAKGITQMENHWHIIRCTSGQEGRAERYLERMGYPHGWHPTEKVRLSESVYQRICQAAKRTGMWVKGKPPKRYKVRPFVHGYVFLPSDTVDIDRIKRNPFGAWMEVLVINDEPYRLTDAKMADMKQVPERVKALLDDAERKEREAWEAKRPVVGEAAKVLGGAFEGHIASVVSISNGEVTFDGVGPFGQVKVAEKLVERAA